MTDSSIKDVIAAIGIIQQYLRDDFIVEECRNEPTEGCASCEAVELERRLEWLKEALS